mgnify:CR=1 FL=1
MATEKFWMEEDLDCCMSCGSSPYLHSKTAGLCLDCNPADSRYTGAGNEIQTRASTVEE